MSPLKKIIIGALVALLIAGLLASVIAPVVAGEKLPVAQTTDHHGQTATISSTSHPLNEAQKQAIKSILAETKKKAEPLSLKLAQTAKQVYENMLADQPDEALRRKLSNAMKDLTGELVLLKGQSIREVVNVLTPEQKRLVKSEMEKPGAPADLMELIVRVFNIPEK